MKEIRCVDPLVVTVLEKQKGALLFWKSSKFELLWHSTSPLFVSEEQIVARTGWKMRETLKEKDAVNIEHVLQDYTMNETTDWFYMTSHSTDSNGWVRTKTQDGVVRQRKLHKYTAAGIAERKERKAKELAERKKRVSCAAGRRRLAVVSSRSASAPHKGQTKRHLVHDAHTSCSATKPKQPKRRRTTLNSSTRRSVTECNHKDCHKPIRFNRYGRGWCSHACCDASVSSYEKKRTEALSTLWSSS
jgi:hypothetical protein